MSEYSNPIRGHGNIADAGAGAHFLSVRLHRTETAGVQHHLPGPENVTVMAGRSVGIEPGREHTRKEPAIVLVFVALLRGAGCAACQSLGAMSRLPYFPSTENARNTFPAITGNREYPAFAYNIPPMIVGPVPLIAPPRCRYRADNSGSDNND